MISTSTEPIYLAGPTGVGKSEIAVVLAERIGGEIVGADAFQVYCGLDLLTAKPDAQALARVPHHLIGEIALSEHFDVARYRDLATARIAEIAARGRTPIVVGGTGLYLRALTHGLADLPPADATLRAELEAEPLPKLAARYAALDPIGARQVDLKNPRRVIRALEVCLLTGKPFSSFRAQEAPTKPVRGWVLIRGREDLYARIKHRTEDMFADRVVAEVRNSGEISPTAAQAIGYREIQALIRGEMHKPECIERIQQLTRNYAKRQLTWFRKETYLTPLEVARDEEAASVVDRISRTRSDG